MIARSQRSGAARNGEQLFDLVGDETGLVDISDQ